MLADDLTRTTCGIRRFRREKLTTSRKAYDRAFGDNYSWHWGTDFSSSEPQLFNQPVTSSPVR